MVVLTVLASASVVACGRLFDDEKSSKPSEECKVEPVASQGEGQEEPCATKPEECKAAASGADGAAPEDAGDSAGQDGAGAQSSKTLPINDGAALRGWSLGAVAPAPETPESEAPVVSDASFPVDECTASTPQSSGLPRDTNDEMGAEAGPADHSRGKGPAACTPSGLRLDRAAPGNSSTRPEPQSAALCPADAVRTKNAADGSSADPKLEWKILDGLKVYQDAKLGCVGLGADWHLAQAQELDAVLKTDGFWIGAETDCSTQFWAAGAEDQTGACRANLRGAHFTAGTGSPLPINGATTIRNETDTVGVMSAHSALCVKGHVRPNVSCSTGVAALFARHPLGIKDASGLTWAEITVATFQDSTATAAQCAKGATQGWRLPTQAELSAAVQQDLFATAAYDGADASCPDAWHEPGASAPARSCGYTATNEAGESVLRSGSDCGSGRNVVGLCVKGP
jgi:hypothetical protein